MCSGMSTTNPPPVLIPPRQRGGGKTQSNDNCAKNGVSGIHTNI